jgi:FMN phosphatase YigB (HAD superfamily)
MKASCSKSINDPYDTQVTLRAAFFDVGDTLVEHWAPRAVVNSHARAQVCGDLGERPWLDELLEARLEPTWPVSLAHALAKSRSERSAVALDDARQDTLAWYRAWFRDHGIDPGGLDFDRLRSLLCVPLAEISSPVRGAFEAVRWCKENGLRVVLVTNTLARGDAEALADWRRFGLDDAIHGIVSSHNAGWRKPHPAIFERALELAGAGADEAFHVGDNLVADVWGAQQVGIRGVWRRSARAVPSTDERGAPPDPWIDRSRRDPASCDHPSELLSLRQDEVLCGACGAPAGIEVRPDAVLDDLTGLPDIARRWMS